MEFVVLFVALGLLVPLAMWASDEFAGRLRWTRMVRRVDEVSLGAGAFRGSTAAVERLEVLRARAPWWVRAIALTAYIPSGFAVFAVLPWLLGLLYTADLRESNVGLARVANLLLVLAYPFGCWAALRLWALGRALLTGSLTGFRTALRRALQVELPLNVVLVIAALGLAIHFEQVDALWLAVVPVLTLGQILAIAVAGFATLDDDVENQAPAPQENLNQVSSENP